MNATKIFSKYILTGHERSVKAKKQTLYSLFFKLVSIVVGLALVPLILNYLDAERYGIWLTMSSIIAWFSFFDIGLGNGLRNRFTEAIAKNDQKLAKIYVSTTYAILIVLFTIVLIMFFIINPYLNWQAILNTKVIGTKELSSIAMVVFIFFILRFLFQVIGIILKADQRPGVANSFGPIGNFLALIIIYILTKTTDGSLFTLAAVLSIIPVIIFILGNIFFFSNDYKIYSPSYKFIDLSKTKDLLGIGLKFFYIQIAAIILFSMTNFLIAQFADQKSVAAYNVAYKYLFMVNMIYSIALTPIWSAVTDAYSRNDFVWLNNILKKLNIFSLLMVIILAVLLFISPYVYEIWVGNNLNIPFSLSLIISLYLMSQVIIAPYSSYINGFGKLKLGLYMITCKIILFIPLAYFLGHKYGAFGIVLVMFLVQVPSLIIEPIQVYKLVGQKAYGIWNK